MNEQGKRYRVAFITVILPHYRVSFYEKLTGNNPEFQWNVYHGIQKKDVGRPAFEGEVGFPNDTFFENTIKIRPFSLVFNKGLRSKVKNYDPDVIVLPGIAGNITNRTIASWARRKGKKIIIWTCGWEPGLAKGFILSVKNYFVARYLKKGSFHLTYSNKASQYVESLGIPSEKIKTCYNGIEIDHLMNSEKSILKKSESVVVEYNLKGYITFLYVGGLIPEKKVHLLINAFSQLREKYDHIKLLIIGDGPYKASMMDLLNRINDDHIYYLGRIVDSVDSYFAAADCLVMPGIGGLALNQAMFWGKLCIVSEADGTEDDLVIPGKTGFRFEKNNQKSLQIAMEEMIELDKDKLDSMSQEARNFILNYSNTGYMVQIFSTTFRSLLP